MLQTQPSQRKIATRTLLLVVALLCMLCGHFCLYAAPDSAPCVTPTTTNASNKRRVLLIPLDSRPPCLDFVVALGRLVDVDVITPPTELLDYYSQSANTADLRDWTRANLPGCDYALLSIDELLHGGLLASREAKKTPADADELLAFLESLHTAHPEIPLYAYSILPRITPPDSIDGREERKALMGYSRLSDIVDLATVPDADDLRAIDELRAAVPSAHLAHYDALFADNTRLHRRLMALAARGVLSRLVIGQDDGEQYGIPNRERRRLEEAARAARLSSDLVFFTHGADEIAQTLLAFAEAKRDGYRPRVRCLYHDAATPWRRMPYMAGTTEATAEEKIALVGGVQADTPPSNDNAQTVDFTLYLAAGDTDVQSARHRAAGEVKHLLNRGERVALVDLSVHFAANESLLPHLVRADAPLHALSAYAGWNTASNAIGTAVAHATLLELATRRAESTDDLRRLYAAHLAFLDARFVEDYFYLKETIDTVNLMLRKAGYTNVNDLDLAHNAIWTNDMLQLDLTRRIAPFTASRAFRAPLAVAAPGGAPLRLAVRRLRVNAWNPWPRTFEIRLTAEPQIDELR